MERLRQLFGRGEQEKQMPHRPHSSVPEPSQPTQPSAAETPSVHDHDRVEETRVGQMIASARKMVLRVVPLAEDDCLSCKLIATGVLWTAAGYVFITQQRVKVKYTGFWRKIYVFQALALGTGLSLLGTARLLDLSIFEKDSEGNNKSISVLLKEDFEKFNKFKSKLFPSNNTSDSKADS